jgi:glycolate dehydrogenase FAD-binding subunit
VSTAGISVDVVRDLRAICGQEHVAERVAHGIDVSPASADEVAEVLRIANEQALSVAPAGGNTELNRVQADVVLHTNRLTQVEHYDHADLTVGLGAGTTVAQLNAMVGADNLMFAADPPLPERCTVGGLLATAGHGPLRHGYGSVRDFCIGVRFVTGDGRRAKGGGRVVKNVAGYDLMKLLIGSYGSLAIITSASFKLFPAPRQTRTFLAEFATANEALQFRDLVLHSPLAPMCLELVSPKARKLMRPEMTADAWVMCVRAAGSDAVLARYRAELGSAITRQLEADDERGMWRAIESFPASSVGYEQSVPDGDSSQVVELAVPARDLPSVVDTLVRLPAIGGSDVAMVGRVGIGHLRIAARGGAYGISESCGALAAVLRKQLGDSFGMKVNGAANPWPIPPSHPASMHAVKHALDPRNVLRGREIF